MNLSELHRREMAFVAPPKNSSKKKERNLLGFPSYESA